MIMTDVIAELAALRPEAATIERLWPAQQQDDTLAAVLAHDHRPDRRDHRLTRSPRQTRRRRGVAGAAILGVAAAVVSLQVVLPQGGPGGATPAAATALEGLAITAAASDPADLARPGQFRHLVERTWQAAMPEGGMPIRQTVESWIATDGRSWRRDHGNDNTGHLFDEYLAFPPGGDQTYSASPAYLASLPTDTSALQHYLRAHVSGSTSRNEAVFVAVGDLLRTGIAPPALRAAAIRVLARTSHVALGTTRSDALGRPVIRFDFIDNKGRPDEIQSLLFDPKTAALVGEIDSNAAGTPWFTSTLVSSGVTANVPPPVLARAQPVR
jgi:hypothetical protein